MLILKKIVAKNFLSIGNTLITIDLNTNSSTLIVGANGSGKSTLLDMLTFVLFNKPFRSINKPQLINSVNGGDLLVEILFDIGKAQYRVVRGMKPTRFEIYQNGNRLNQDSNLKDFQTHLETKILNLTYKSFTQVVVLGSATFIPFMQLTAAHRRDVVEDLLGLRIFSTMNTLLKERCSNHKAEVERNELEIELKKKQINLQRDHVAVRKEDREEIKKKILSKIQRSMKEHSRCLQSMKKYKKELREVQDSTNVLGWVVFEIRKIETLMTRLSDSRLRMEREMMFFADNESCPSCEQSIDEEYCLKHIEARKTKIAERTDAMKVLRSRLDVANRASKQKADYEDTANKIKQEILVLNTSIASLDGEIESLEREVDAKKKTKVGSSGETKILMGFESELVELEKTKQSLVILKSVHTVAMSFLKDSGVKTRIVNQYLPVINTLMNDYLSTMDFFVNFVLDDQFSETIKSRYRDEFSYHSFSEGEKKRIDLALLFTWREVAKLRNSINTNLLILDETFDSSLDADGTENLTKILSTLDRSVSLFVISHKTDTLYDRFDNVLKFSKVRGFTRMSVDK